VATKFCAGNSVAVLRHAARFLGEGSPRPTLMVDDGVENFNAEVDALADSGLFQRVLAQVALIFSNSMIEAWWRQLKHNWLYLNRLDSVTRVESLVARYVSEHNSTIPHAAFDGQTPDEMFFGTGAAVPDLLAARRDIARRERMAANRAKHCSSCA
jgi:putative transposase